VLKAPDDAGVKEKGRGRVLELMQRFPVYP
jgi:hypothetical protein